MRTGNKGFGSPLASYVTAQISGSRLMYSKYDSSSHSAQVKLSAALGAVDYKHIFLLAFLYFSSLQ